MTMTREQLAAEMRSTRRRATLIGALVPLAVAIVATALMVSWLPGLPDPIAVHWSGAGPDGFGPALPFVFLPLAVTVLYSAFSLAVSWRTSPAGRLSWSQKVLLCTGPWLTTLLSVGFAGSVGAQFGLADARDAPAIGPLLAVGAGAGLLLAVAGWFVLRKAESVEPAGVSPTPLGLEGQERVSWTHTARLGTAAFVVVLGAALLTVVAIVAAIASSRAPLWLPAGVLALILVLFLTNTWWRVVIDRRGFLIRSSLGWPRKRIPLADIRSVQVVDVHPTRDFGGWGWRWAGAGRSGVILRAGEGIEVATLQGKHFVVTVDDAQTGAAALAALLAPHPA